MQALGTNVCIACTCWNLFPPARVVWLVLKHLCASQQWQTIGNERTQMEGAKQDRKGGDEDERRQVAEIKRLRNNMDDPYCPVYKSRIHNTCTSFIVVCVCSSFERIHQSISFSLWNIWTSLKVPSFNKSWPLFLIRCNDYICSPDV